MDTRSEYRQYLTSFYSFLLKIGEVIQTIEIIGEHIIQLCFMFGFYPLYTPARLRLYK